MPMQLSPINGSITCPNTTVAALATETCSFTYTVAEQDREQGFAVLNLAADVSQDGLPNTTVTYYGSDVLNVTCDATMTLTLLEVGTTAHTDNGKLCCCMVLCDPKFLSSALCIHQIVALRLYSTAWHCSSLAALHLHMLPASSISKMLAATCSGQRRLSMVGKLPYMTVSLTASLIKPAALPASS
jgi:hypothetical protein